MSIYATVLQIAIPSIKEAKVLQAGETSSTGFLEIIIQAVPPHIGSPDELEPGETDPYPWLPPPMLSSDAEYPRAVVVVGPDRRKGTERSGQEYVNPLFTITGKEYVESNFCNLLAKICEALRQQEFAVMA